MNELGKESNMIGIKGSVYVKTCAVHCGVERGEFNRHQTVKLKHLMSAVSSLHPVLSPLFEMPFGSDCGAI